MIQCAHLEWTDGDGRYFVRGKDWKDAIRLAMAECVSLEQEVLSDG